MSRSNQNSSAKKSKLSSSKKQEKPTSQSSVTKNKLIQFFMKTAQLQRKFQIIKQMLCQEEQFTPASLFNRIDAARKGYITQRDIEQYLIDNKIPHKGSELKTLFGRINSNQSQAGVNLRQFQNFILPNQNARLRYFTMRRPIYIPLQHQKLSQKIQWITCKFFTQIIKEYTNLMQYNTALISSFDFNAYNIFEVIGAGKQTINAQQISGFMTQNNVEISLQQVGCIVKLIDKKGEGRIHLDDFKLYLATLGLKKQHQIFDQLSPIPLLKNFNQEVKLNIKDRDKCLKDRYLDNKSYIVRQDQNRLSKSRKNYS